MFVADMKSYSSVNLSVLVSYDGNIRFERSNRILSLLKQDSSGILAYFYFSKTSGRDLPWYFSTILFIQFFYLSIISEVRLNFPFF